VFSKLFESRDISALVFFRIVYAILAASEAGTQLIVKHLTLEQYTYGKFHFSYYGFQWVTPFPEPFMSLFFVLLFLTSIGVLVGWRYRWNVLFCALGFTYLFLVEKTNYLNHGYLWAVISWWMVLFPAHQNLSVDAHQGRVEARDTIPWWPLFILQFSMGVVYFYGGIAKINTDWLNAMPLLDWMEYKRSKPVIGWIIAQDWVAWLMSYGGLFLDLFVVPLMIWKRTRIFAFSLVVGFHFTNLLIFLIGIFPFLSVALTALYFPSNWPRKTWLKLRDRFPILEKINHWWIADEQNLSYAPSTPIGLLIGTYILIMLLLPFRHHYFPGDVAWTEEGHRYAWRMMLRGKKGKGHFIIKESGSSRTKKVRPRTYLNKRQSRKMLTHPDMILQFAHFLRDEYQEKGWQNPEVYAHVKSTLNGRPYALLVDSTRNLSTVEWSFLEPSDWIVHRDE